MVKNEGIVGLWAGTMPSVVRAHVALPDFETNPCELCTANDGPAWPTELGGRLRRMQAYTQGHGFVLRRFVHKSNIACRSGRQP